MRDGQESLLKTDIHPFLNFKIRDEGKKATFQTTKGASYQVEVSDEN